MSRPAALWPRIRRVWATVGVILTVAFVGWSLVAYRATDEARRASLTDPRMQVVHADGVWRFDAIGSGAPKQTVLVFFPGALVDPRAYAPLARATAAAGFATFIVELPRRGAFGGADDAAVGQRLARVLRGLDPDAARVVVGGHSRGAVVAARVASSGFPRLAGLVVIGSSHPRDVDLSALKVPVAKIVGTRDGLATPRDVERNARKLPAHTRWTWIDGGNHSQFGWYGFQPMDRFATIGADQQRRLMTDAVLELLGDVER